MKRFLVCLCIFLMVTTSVFAYQNTYRLSSDEVQTFLTLRRASETMTPDPTYPVSGTQLLTLVKGLDTSKLSGTYVEMYQDLVDKLSNEDVLFGGNGSGFDGHINVLGVQYIKGNDNTTYNILPYKDWLPFLDLEGEVFVNDLMYGHFNLNVSHYLENDGVNPVDYRKENNILYTLKNFQFPMPMYLPDNCYMSFGYKNFNFTIGRERLGAGNGFTGNVLFGENSRKDEFAKISFVTDNVSYDGTLISYPLQDVWGTIVAENYKKNIFTHRLSFNIADKVSLTAYEVALLYAKSPFVDLRLFNPAMFLHNTFMYYDYSMNNVLGAEITAMLPFGIQVNGQFFLDQICANVIGETPEDTGETAYIALANVSKSFEVPNGNLDVYVEGVYGNPYAYLKNSHAHGTEGGNHATFDQVDFVMDDKTYGSPVDLQYMGYKYGGNLISLAAGAKLNWMGYKFTGDVQYLSKGQYGIRDGEFRKAQGIEDNAHINENTFMATLGFEGTFFKGLDVSAKASFLNHMNYHHEAGVNKTDLQFSVGVNISVLDFFNCRKPL